MKLYTLFAALVFAVSAKTVFASNGTFSYLSALQKNLPPLQRSASDPTVNRPSRPQYRISRPHSRSQSTERGECHTNYHLDYLQLTLQWGPGFCLTSPKACVKKENRLFSVHGMWPQMRGGEGPEFCCFDNTFNYNTLSPMLPALNKYWFSFFSSDNRGFWSHEWLKHGTCLRDVTKLQGEQLFFGTTMNIMQQLPILETLAKDNIVPGTGKVYNSQSIINSLKQLTNGKRVMISCDLEHQSPTPLLTGLNICFDLNLNFIDCHQSKKRCQNQVVFLN